MTGCTAHNLTLSQVGNVQSVLSRSFAHAQQGLGHHKLSAKPWGVLLYWPHCCVLAAQEETKILWDKLIFRHTGMWGQLLKSRFDCQGCQRKQNNTMQCPICKERREQSDVAFKSFYELWSHLTIISFSISAMVGEHKKHFNFPADAVVEAWLIVTLNLFYNPTIILDKLKYALIKITYRGF